MNVTPKVMPKRRVDHAASVKPLSISEKPIESRDEKTEAREPVAAKSA